MITWGQEQTRRDGSLRVTLIWAVILVWAAALAYARPSIEKAGYLQLDCAGYVAAVNHHGRIGAKAFFNGDTQGYHQIASTMLATGREGDVAAFHGVHVAVFHLGAWHDSDPAHNGAGLCSFGVNPNDPWFQGPVKIFRRIQ